MRELFDDATGERADAVAAASRYDVTHMTTAIRLVREGLGITVLPALALPRLELDGLRACRLSDASAKRTIGMLHRQDRSLSAAAAAFAAKLAEVARDLEEPDPKPRRSRAK